MSRRRNPVMLIAAIALFGAIFSLAANVATGTLPELLPPAWKPFLPWIAWPLALLSLLVLIALPVRQYLDEHTSTAPTTSQEQRNRSRMLEKVRAAWIGGMLEGSLQNEVCIELGLKATTDLVASPTKRMRQPNRPERILPPGTTIRTVFEELAGELLILGAPGASKTTLLLELARDLLNRAQQDETQPIPVVFNLSSWAEKPRPLKVWLVDELRARYDVPRRVGQGWLETNALLPLLDGLDEVASEQRAACVTAINNP